MIPEYERKRAYKFSLIPDHVIYAFQQSEYRDQYIAFDHIASKKYRDRLPLFIDSIMNLRLMFNEHNCGRKLGTWSGRGGGYDYETAERFEMLLAHDDFGYHAKVLNFVTHSSFEDIKGAEDEIYNAYFDMWNDRPWERLTYSIVDRMSELGGIEL